MTAFYAPEVSDGEFLGDYQVIRVLGRGPTGTCYHVMSNVLGKEFVLKSLSLSDRIPLDWIDRLEAQTALLSKLVHRHIDHLVNSGRSQKLWFCLKDFVHDGEGEPCNLNDYRMRFAGTLSEFQVYHIAIQMLEGLDYAQRYQDMRHKGICHGNLKPENILISYCRGRGVPDRPNAPFEVKLSDFQPYGLREDWVVLESFAQWEKSLINYSTHLGEKAAANALSSIFTPFDYQAPEFQELDRPTPAADIFSVGVILYELLTGHFPSGRYEPASVLRPDIPKAWDEIISRCLQQVPELRYASAAQLLEELRGTVGLNMEEAEIVIPHVEDADDESAEEAPKERHSLTPPGMVYIPAGSFLVGSADCGEDAMPQHSCDSEGFYIDRTPVTNAQFAQFVHETGYVTEAEQGEGAPIWIDGEWRLIPGINWRNPSGQRLPERFEWHPVTQISYQDAQAYCQWLGRRLPTEQEWEYAARGGQRDVRFPWGNTISAANANYNSDGTSEVMHYPANGYGLYDMAGNVWEWTGSSYLPYPGNQNPSPHFGEQYQVVRGGSWMYEGAHCMVSHRNANQREHCYPTLGFRTVCDFQSGGRA